MSPVQPDISYRFSDNSLLKLALSHRSSGKDNNERPELLGDSILGFIIAETLYQRFPEASEGEISRLRAELVKKATLAEIARELKLGQALILGEGAKLNTGTELAGKDAKTRLQEYLQAQGMELPEYELAELSGKDHEQKFTVSCKISLLDRAVSGMGNSRREAEQQVASAILEKLGL